MAWTVYLACSRGTFTATATIWTGTAVQGVTAFILTHVLVDQVSLVRVRMGHASLLKGYIHCNRHHLDMYSCSGCDCFHPDTYTCGSGESVSSGCVHLCLDTHTYSGKPVQGSFSFIFDTHTYSGKPVQGSFSFILAYILVDQVSQSVQGVYTFVLIHIPTQVSQFRVHLASSWHIYLWIR